MFDNDKRFLCIDIPISFDNGNRGQSKHWGSHQDARKKAASALRSATFMAKAEDGAWHEVMPSECHIDQRVDVWATRVLGPGDRDHHDHFHFDLASHGRRGTYRVCK